MLTAPTVGIAPKYCIVVTAASFIVAWKPAGAFCRTMPPHAPHVIGWPWRAPPTQLDGLNVRRQPCHRTEDAEHRHVAHVRRGCSRYIRYCAVLEPIGFEFIEGCMKARPRIGNAAFGFRRGD